VALYYLWALSVELAYCYLSGAENFWVSSRFFENSCTVALGVFKVRVIIATYEAVFLGKKYSVSEIGGMVLFFFRDVRVSMFLAAAFLEPDRRRARACHRRYSVNAASLI
jgi:hypothetical protein